MNGHAFMHRRIGQYGWITYVTELSHSSSISVLGFVSNALLQQRHSLKTIGKNKKTEKVTYIERNINQIIHLVVVIQVCHLEEMIQRNADC